MFDGKNRDTYETWKLKMKHKIACEKAYQEDSGEEAAILYIISRTEGKAFDRLRSRHPLESNSTNLFRLRQEV